MRRRRDGDGDPAALREARCQWFWRYRRECDVTMRLWADWHPFPGGFESLSVQDLSDQAACRCEWCASFDDDVDARDALLWAPRDA